MKDMTTYSIQNKIGPLKKELSEVKYTKEINKIFVCSFIPDDCEDCFIIRKSVYISKKIFDEFKKKCISTSAESEIKYISLFGIRVFEAEEIKDVLKNLFIIKNQLPFMSETGDIINRNNDTMLEAKEIYSFFLDKGWIEEISS